MNKMLETCISTLDVISCGIIEANEKTTLNDLWDQGFTQDYLITWIISIEAIEAIDISSDMSEDLSLTLGSFADYLSKLPKAANDRLYPARRIAMLTSYFSQTIEELSEKKSITINVN